jgi:hypothetical protein
MQSCLSQQAWAALWVFQLMSPPVLGSHMAPPNHEWARPSLLGALSSSTFEGIM